MDGESKSRSDEDALSRRFIECTDILKQIGDLAGRLFVLAEMLDELGDVRSNPEGTAKRRLAELRDHADFCLCRAACDLSSRMRVRAEVSRSTDLVADSVLIARGDGEECLKMIEIFHKLMGDDTEGTGRIEAETFPDQFLWDLVERVEAFPALAELYPKHLYFAARHFQGLPMMVSHHIDVTPEYQRLSKMLGVGTWHPLDVSPRRKRGGHTPAMRYLEPLVWRLNSLRMIH